MAGRDTALSRRRWRWVRLAAAVAAPEYPCLGGWAGVQPGALEAESTRFKCPRARLDRTALRRRCAEGLIAGAASACCQPLVDLLHADLRGEGVLWWLDHMHRYPGSPGRHTAMHAGGAGIQTRNRSVPRRGLRGRPDAD